LHFRSSLAPLVGIAKTNSSQAQVEEEYVAAGLMKEPRGMADKDVKEVMSGNICRCGAYKNILTAIQEVCGHKA
jgi:aerobic-type carbon monoxide dehydrogenase small subunit (CoxS/CutS family)